MAKSFLLIPHEILINKQFCAEDKMILTYLHNLRSKNKAFFGSHDYLADTLGLSKQAIDKRIGWMCQYGIIRIEDGALKLNFWLKDLSDWYYNPRAQEEIQSVLDAFTKKAAVKELI